MTLHKDVTPNFNSLYLHNYPWPSKSYLTNVLFSIFPKGYSRWVFYSFWHVSWIVYLSFNAEFYYLINFFLMFWRLSSTFWRYPCLTFGCSHWIFWKSPTYNSWFSYIFKKIFNYFLFIAQIIFLSYWFFQYYFVLLPYLYRFLLVNCLYPLILQPICSKIFIVFIHPPEFDVRDLW